MSVDCFAEDMFDGGGSWGLDDISNSDTFNMKKNWSEVYEVLACGCQSSSGLTLH